MEWHGKRKCDENEEKEGDERNNRPIGDAPEFRPIKSVDCVCVCVCVWAFHWLGPVSVIEKRRKEKEFHKGKGKREDGRKEKNERKKGRKRERKKREHTHTHTHKRERRFFLPSAFVVCFPTTTSISTSPQAIDGKKGLQRNPVKLGKHPGEVPIIRSKKGGPQEKLGKTYRSSITIRSKTR